MIRNVPLPKEDTRSVYHWNIGVRDPECDPKSSVAQNKTHGYHIDFMLCGRSRDLLGISCPLALAFGTGEPIRAKYMCFIGTTNDGCHTWHRHV